MINERTLFDDIIRENAELHSRVDLLIKALCEGRDLVDMLATDIPDMAAWSTEVNKLLEESD